MTFSYIKSQQDALFLRFILVKNSTCFGQTYCPSSGVLILYSQQMICQIECRINIIYSIQWGPRWHSG
jgi:hypothetical protein